MENKIKFSDQPRKVKIVYGAVIGVLCLTAVAVGILSGTNKNTELPLEEDCVKLHFSTFEVKTLRISKA